MPEPLKSPAPVGTLLRIVCEIPEELEKPFRSYRANIGWTAGNVTRGETFTMRVAEPIFRFRLRQMIPAGAHVVVQFTVDEDPPFKTKFTRGDWRCAARAPGHHPQDSVRMDLARFRLLDGSRYPLGWPDDGGHDRAADGATRREMDRRMSQETAP